MAASMLKNTKLTIKMFDAVYYGHWYYCTTELLL